MEVYLSRSLMLIILPEEEREGDFVKQAKVRELVIKVSRRNYNSSVEDILLKVDNVELEAQIPRWH